MVFPALDYTHGSILPKQKNEKTLVIFYENTVTVSAAVSVQDATDISTVTPSVLLKRAAAMVSRPTMTPSLANPSVQLAVVAPAAPDVSAASDDDVAASPAKTEVHSGSVRSTTAKVAVSVPVSVQDATDVSAVTTTVPLDRAAAMASRPTMAPSLTNASVQLAVVAPAIPAVPAASGDGVVHPVAQGS